MAFGLSEILCKQRSFYYSCYSSLIWNTPHNRFTVAFFFSRPGTMYSSSFLEAAVIAGGLQKSFFPSIMEE